jgi:hypothetical protein
VTDWVTILKQAGIPEPPGRTAAVAEAIAYSKAKRQAKK